MLIKVGKTYKNGLGEFNVIVEHRDDESYPFVDSEGQTYTSTGKFCGAIDSNRDLLAEVVGLDSCPSYWVINPSHPKQEKEIKMSLQLEVGKTYKDRKGNLVTITDKRDYDCIYPYTCHGNTSTYMPDGRFREEDMYHDYDLVEEVKFKEETKMQAQIITIKCTLVVRDIEGTLTLQVHPKDEFWRADSSTTVLDSNFELVLPKAKVQELYLEALNSNLDKAEATYNDALETRDSGLAFIRSL